MRSTNLHHANVIAAGVSRRCSSKTGTRKTAVLMCKPGGGGGGGYVFLFGNCECLSATQTSSGVCGHDPMWRAVQPRERDCLEKKTEDGNSRGRGGEKDTKGKRDFPFALQEDTCVVVVLTDHVWACFIKWIPIIWSVLFSRKLPPELSEAVWPNAELNRSTTREHG